MREFPTDTVLDDPNDPQLAGAPEKAIRLLKTMILEHPTIKACQIEKGWSDTQTINAFEYLRRNDLARIIVEEDGARYKIEVLVKGMA